MSSTHHRGHFTIDFGVATKFSGEKFLKDVDPASYLPLATKHGIDAIVLADWRNDDAFDHLREQKNLPKGYLLNRSSDRILSVLPPDSNKPLIYLLRGAKIPTYDSTGRQEGLLTVVGHPKLPATLLRQPHETRELLHALTQFEQSRGATVNALCIASAPFDNLAGGAEKGTLDNIARRIQAIELNAYTNLLAHYRTINYSLSKNVPLVASSNAKRASHFGKTYSILELQPNDLSSPDSVLDEIFKTILYHRQDLVKESNNERTHREHSRVGFVYTSNFLGAVNVLVRGRLKAGEGSTVRKIAKRYLFGR